MDIKTLIHLLVEGDIEPRKAIKLIANESNVNHLDLENIFREAFVNAGTTGARGPRFTKDEIDRVISLWRAGNTKGQIAKEIGRDRTSITNLISRLRRQGIDLPLRPLEHLTSNGNHQLQLFDI